MKILKGALAVLGVIGLIVAAFLLARFALDARELIGAAQRYDSAKAIQSPFTTTALVTGLGVLAGFLLGLAAGLPSLTRRQIEREAAAGIAARPAPVVPPAPAGGSYEPPAPTV
ncbi:MAG: hypothetical protein IPL36_00450 [Nigerium sp.]|nr:hypothetical protein [Nigerium sp.]